MGRITTQTATQDIINPETGEIHRISTSKTVKIKMEETDKFLQIYYTYLSSFYNLRYADDLKLIIKFSEIADFNKGTVYISTAKRRDIEDELSIHTNNFSKSIRRLKDLKLISGEKGSFTINPEVFWKGEAKIREQFLKNESLKLIFEFKK